MNASAVIGRWNTLRSNPELLERAGCFLIFLLVLKFAFYSVSTPILLAALVLAAIRRHRIEAAAVLNVVFGATGFVLGTHSFFAVSIGTVLASDVSHFQYALIYIAVLLFYYVYVKIAIFLPNFLAIALLLSLSLVSTWLYPDIGILGKLACLIFYQGLWYNAFYVRARSSSNNVTALDFLACQRAFFSADAMPIPPMLSSYLAQPIDSKQRVQLQRSAVCLLLLLVVLNFVEQNLKSLAVSFPLAEIIVRAPFTKYSSGRLDLLMAAHFGGGVMKFLTRWFITLAAFTDFLIKLMLRYGFQVALCQLIGLPVLSPVYKLFSSRSLFQFFERSNHYYVRILMDLFIGPAFRLLAFLKNARLRFTVAFMFGICGGGLVYHYLNIFFRDFDRETAGNLAKITLTSLWYWLIMSLVTWWSLTYERSRDTRLSTWPHRALRFSAYFIISAALITLFDIYTSLQGRLHFFASLFCIWL